jgi:outer membrane protein assembly factor BamB
MKIKKFLLFFLAIFVLLLLSACAGGPAQNSWPGLTVDMERNQAYLASGTAVTAVDLSTGLEKWHYPAKANNKITFYSSPALTSDGQVVAGSYDSNLYSLDAERGTENWIFDQPTEPNTASQFIAGPLYAAEKLFAPSASYNIYALDGNGQLGWQYETGNALWSTPVSDGETVYQASMDHHIYAFDAASGNLVWKSDDLGGSILGSPTLSPDGVLYVGTVQKEMLAISADSGREIWRKPISSWGWAGPLWVEGVLYFGDLNGTIYAMNAADGSPVWAPIDTGSTPTVYEMAEAPDGSLTWTAKEAKQTTDHAIPEQPILVEGVLYFTSETGSMFAIDAASGELLPEWPKFYGGKLYAGPRLAGEHILLAPMAGPAGLIAVDKDGNQQWQFPPARQEK